MIIALFSDVESDVIAKPNNDAMYMTKQLG